MCFLKLNYLFVIKVFSFFISANCEFLCDEYLHSDGERQFSTIAGYNLPRSKYSIKLNESVPCPCSAVQLCLRKCCVEDDVFKWSTKKCLRANDSTQNENQKIDTENLPLPPGDYTPVYGSFCDSISRSLESVKFLQNGFIQLDGRYLPLEKYCIEFFVEEGEFKLLECKESTPKPTSTEQKIFTICLAISIFCLIITLLVYSCIKKLRNLPGQILLCYVTSFLTSQMCLLAMQFISLAHGNICVAAAYLFQFSFSATFFWLNVMCFDLWLTFRGHRFAKRPHGLGGKSKKFIIYCCYAWGSPLIISTITLLIELSIIPGDFVKPEIGQISCWFRTQEATFWYLYSYTSILLLLNLYMFFTTLLNLCSKNGKLEKVFKKDGNKKHNEQEKQRFLLYFKLFLIMGISWIMDVLSYYFQHVETMKLAWFLTDLTSTLQGVLILLIFVCNKRALGSLNEKWCPNKNLIRQGTNITRKSSCSTTTTTYSQKGLTQATTDVETEITLHQSEPQKTTNCAEED